MQHFKEFVDSLVNFKRALDTGVKHTDLFPPGHPYNFSGQLERSLALLDRITVFSVDDKIKRACCLHKSKVKQYIIPHDPMFIDVDFKQEEYSSLEGSHIIGILLTKTPLFGMESANKPTTEVVGSALNTIYVSYRDGQIWLDSGTFNYRTNEGIKFQNKKVMSANPKSVRDDKFIANFINNLLTFINDPDVELIRFKRGEVNQKRRMRNGKMPLPDSITVKLTGHMKVYVDSFYEKAKSGSSGWHYNYRFPVRAHKRNYRDKSTGAIIKTVEIREYVKGQGPLVEKKYILK